MTLIQHIRLILHGWRHDRLFTIISLFSLTAGICFTCLLTAFVTYGSNIESGNPNRDRIVRLTQPMPVSDKTVQGSFVYGGSVPEIMKALPEAESFLRTQTQEKIQVQVGKEIFRLDHVMATDSNFTRFFPLQVLQGDIREAITRPDQVALSQETATRIFGTAECIGNVLTLPFYGKQLVRVAAVYRHPDQSVLKTDALLALKPEQGINCYLMLHPETDLQTFRKHLAGQELPCLLGTGHYQAQTLQESYFDTRLEDADYCCFRHRNPQMLHIGLVAALLILFIGCSNYINLSFSRLLKQIHTLRIEMLMGAGSKDIRIQLFTDTFLLILLSFLFSLLLMHDGLQVFNRMLDTQITTGYLFSWQVLPWLAVFLAFMAVVPSLYTSRKLIHLSESRYRDFYTGRKRRFITGSLQTLQFTFTLGLLSAFLIIQSQTALITSGGERFRHTLTLYHEGTGTPAVGNWLQEVKGWKETADATASSSGIYSGMIAVILPGQDQNHVQLVDMIECDKNFLSFYRMELQDSVQTMQRLSRLPRPILVNETFIHMFVPSGENPIGQPVTRYVDEASWEGETIAGVIKDFVKLSLDKPVYPLHLKIRQGTPSDFACLTVRINRQEPEADRKLIKKLQEKWEECYPDTPFSFTDDHQFFLNENKDTTSLSDILLLYTAISLLLTFFGLFGQIRFTVRMRLKELCIRRIHGAGPEQILYYLARPFIRYLGVAFTVSTLITYPAMHHWLEGFQYRSGISVMHFLLPLLVVGAFTLLIIGTSCREILKGSPIRFLRQD